MIEGFSMDMRLSVKADYQRIAPSGIFVWPICDRITAAAHQISQADALSNLPLLVLQP